jgi:hypothetical protein
MQRTLYTLPIRDRFPRSRRFHFFIQLRARHRTVSPGDVALAHGPARPDPAPPSAQTPRTAPCDAFPRRYVDRRVHDRPPPFRIGASSRDGRLTPAQPCARSRRRRRYRPTRHEIVWPVRPPSVSAWPLRPRPCLHHRRPRRHRIHHCSRHTALCLPTCPPSVCL